MIAVAWAGIENELAILFCLSMAAVPAVAAAVLGRITNIGNKLEVVVTAMEYGLSESAAKAFRKDFMDSIRKRAKERNTVIHAIWLTHEDYPERLIRTAGLADPEMEMTAYSLKDFIDIELRLVELHLALKQFAQSLLASPASLSPPKSSWTVRAPGKGRPATRRRRSRRTPPSG